MVKRKGKYLAYKVPEGKDKFMALIEKAQMYEIIGLLSDIMAYSLKVSYRPLYEWSDEFPSDEWDQWLIIKRI